MFTGIIQTVGKVKSIQHTGKDIEIIIKSKKASKKTEVGDSIAVNGVCLTVTSIDNNLFSADISHETLQKTTLDKLNKGDLVNLEKAMTLSTPLGGHLVSGHVDGIGRLTQKVPDGKSTRYYFSAPKSLLKYIAVKGSITIEGVSLTVNNIGAAGFDVSIIPHTEENTTFAEMVVNDEVNLEVDLIARYVERLLVAENASGDVVSTLIVESLRERGL